MNRVAERALRFLSVGLLLGGAACSSPGAPDTRRELLSSWSTELIVPLYRDFAAQSEVLSTALGDVCASPTTESVTAARDAWLRARETLKEGEVFAFGPYTRPEYRIGPTLDSWPARPDDVEELLASGSAVDAGTVATLGVWHKGLPVIEYLLYPAGAVAEEQLADARRCEYLTSVGTELVSRARELHLAWSPEGGDFAGQLSGAGRTSTAFRSLKDAFGEIVNRVGFTLENIRRDKLGRPLGDASGGVAAPDSAESRFSGRSVADIQDNLDGIELLYFGDAARAIPGISRYAAERGQDFDSRVREALTATRAALEPCDLPLTDAVGAAPDTVREASAKLGEAQALFQVEIIGALGLSLNFNDNDGD
jgi:predicted lipoprotein